MLSPVHHMGQPLFEHCNSPAPLPRLQQEPHGEVSSQRWEEEKENPNPSLF